MKRILKVTIESPENYDDSNIFSQAVIKSLREFANFIKKKEQTDGIDATGKLTTKNGNKIFWTHTYKPPLSRFADKAKNIPRGKSIILDRPK